MLIINIIIRNIFGATIMHLLSLGLHNKEKGYHLNHQKACDDLGQQLSFHNFCFHSRGLFGGLFVLQLRKGKFSLPGQE